MNTSNSPLQPHGEFIFENNGQMVHVPLDIGALPPGRAAEVDLSALRQQGLVPGNVSMGSLVINYDGQEAALMGRVFGIADDPTFGFYTALETSAVPKLSEAYWTVAGDANSFLTVANFGNQPDQVSIVVTYDGGTLVLPAVALQPYQSTTVNARSLAGDLPQHVTSGGFRIAGSSTRTSRLVAKEHVVSEAARTSQPFYNLIVYVQAFSVSNQYNQTVTDLNLLPGDTQTIYGMEAWSDGTIADDFNDPTSGNNSVVTLTADCCPLRPDQTVTAQGGGDTTITWTTEALTSDPQGDWRTWTAYASANVQVPTSLSVISQGTTTPPPACYVGGILLPYSFWGYIRYQVLDQRTPPQPIRSSRMYVQELIQNTYFNGIGPGSSGWWVWFDSPSYQGSSRNTDANGTFLDVPYGACGSSSATWTEEQLFRIVFNPQASGTAYVVRDHQMNGSMSGPGVGRLTNSFADINIHNP
ncbi:MAG: hypothetical protein LAP87_12855 [Acidobacteriia bacterium]|nr:hypothetical protein [Terriglobia bacterium]